MTNRNGECAISNGEVENYNHAAEWREVSFGDTNWSSYASDVLVQLIADRKKGQRLVLRVSDFTARGELGLLLLSALSGLIVLASFLDPSGDVGINSC